MLISKMSIIFLSLFFCSCTCVSGQKGFGNSEIPAQMHGSMDSLLVTVSDKLVLPNSCNEAGNVAVEFILKADGTKENIRVIRGICGYADSVAIQITKDLGFTPLRIKNVATDSKKILTIPFRKNEK